MSEVISTTAARESDQRCKIIATAERLFREIGFQKTTVADIARELHMSPANIYRFFGAKSEINAAVAQHLMGEGEENRHGPGERCRPAARAHLRK
jgi:AcrR family transcriptional regulator